MKVPTPADFLSTVSFVAGSIAGAALANSAVTSTKLADGAVTSGKLSSGAVSTSALADGAVTNVKISDENVALTKLLLSSFPRCRVYHSATLSIPSGTWTVVPFNSERIDVAGPFRTTASTNLAGTVSKTNGSATLTGSGTAFTTQLKLGDWITVPGGASETKVVTAIASDTSLTVSSNFANTSSEQTATRDDSGRLTIPLAGDYLGVAMGLFAANVTGDRGIRFLLNGTTQIALTFGYPPQGANGTGLQVSWPGPYTLAQNDYVEVQVFQNSGAALNLLRVADYSPEAGVWLCV